MSKKVLNKNLEKALPIVAVFGKGKKTLIFEKV